MKVILLVALAACLFVASMAEVGKEVATTSTPITTTVPSSSAGKLENAGKILDKSIEKVAGEVKNFEKKAEHGLGNSGVRMESALSLVVLSVLLKFFV